MTNTYAEHGREFHVAAEPDADGNVAGTELYAAANSRSHWANLHEVRDTLGRNPGWSAIIMFPWERGEPGEYHPRVRHIGEPEIRLADSHFLIGHSKPGEVEIFDTWTRQRHPWLAARETEDARAWPPSWVDADHPTSNMPYMPPKWVTEGDKALVVVAYLDHEGVAVTPRDHTVDSHLAEPGWPPHLPEDPAESLGDAAGQPDHGEARVTADLTQVQDTLTRTAARAHDEAPFIKAGTLIGEAMVEIGKVRGGFADGDTPNADRIEACWRQLYEVSFALDEGKNMLSYVAAALDDSQNVVSDLLREATGAGGSTEQLKSAVAGAIRSTETAQGSAQMTGLKLEESSRAVNLALETLTTLSKNINWRVISLESMLNDSRDQLEAIQVETLTVQGALIEIKEIEIPETSASLSQTAAELEEHKEQLDALGEARLEIADQLSRNQAAIDEVEMKIQASDTPEERNHYTAIKNTLLEEKQTLEIRADELNQLHDRVAWAIKFKELKMQALDQKLLDLERQLKELQKGLQYQLEEERKYENSINNLERLIPPAKVARNSLGLIINVVKESRAPIQHASSDVWTIFRLIIPTNGKLIQVYNRL